MTPAIRTRGALSASLVAAMWLGAFSVESRASDSESAQPKWSISGYGWLRGLAFKRLIRDLDIQGENERFDAAFVEDVALALTSSLKDEGYTNPTIDVAVTPHDGASFILEDADERAFMAPRDLEAQELEFEVEKGPLFFYRDIEFQGLETIPHSEARRYFRPDNYLIYQKKLARFTEAGMKKGMANLRDALRIDGFKDAAVSLASQSIDPESGAVDLVVEVDAGSQWFIRSLSIPSAEDEEIDFSKVVSVEDYVGAPYSQARIQDLTLKFERALRSNGYRSGKASVSIARRSEEAGDTWVDLVAQTRFGPMAVVGSARVTGAEKSNAERLMRAFPLKPGEPLNQIAARDFESRLSRRGAFESVSVDYEHVGDNVWDIIYQLEEKNSLEVLGLFGYGSYERIRGGIEMQQRNLFGLNHSSQLTLLQSMKSSSARYRYSVPELLGAQTQGFLSGSAMVRSEPTFRREEWDIGLGAQRVSLDGGFDISGRYSFGLLNASDLEIEPELVNTDRAYLGAIQIELTSNHLDNPISPTQGFQWAIGSEFAARALGGQSSFVRGRGSVSWHDITQWGQRLHGRVQYGFVSALGNRKDAMPFNRRFFPGGANTIRGYQETEASPLDVNGKPIGAESSFFFNFEVEQPIAQSWSVVTFLDGVATSASGFGMSAPIYSMGMGFRWATPLGPVRLEYGRNLNPRSLDPKGTLHFSIGFPF